MSDIKISQMTDGGEVQDTDELPAVRSGANVKVDLSGKAPKNPTIVALTANHSIVLSNNNAILEMNSATEKEIFIPADADVNFPIGAQVMARARGLGKVTVTFDSDVIVDTPETYSTAKQHALIGFYKRAANHWVMFGNLEAA